MASTWWLLPRASVPGTESRSRTLAGSRPLRLERAKTPSCAEGVARGKGTTLLVRPRVCACARVRVCACARRRVSVCRTVGVLVVREDVLVVALVGLGARVLGDHERDGEVACGAAAQTGWTGGQAQRGRDLVYDDTAITTWYNRTIIVMTIYMTRINNAMDAGCYL